MQFLLLALQPRFLVLTASVVASIVLLVTMISNPILQAYLVAPLAASVALAGLGLRDLTQTKHAILRNYPIAARLRFLLENIRPEMRQYFFEGEKDGTPFPRDKRAIVYQRAKKELDKRPFGTHYDVYENRYEWLAHSMSPKVPASELFRISIGGPQCTQPYSASVFNISAMSYGSLSANAIRSLNKGAKIGGFAHDTGEGSVSPYHKEFGGDLIWEIGSGYFGCRTLDGTFSPEKFADVAADPQIKMIEIKLSQGAKPGHGGVLPGAKVSAEIAQIRGVEQGRDCISPAQHSAFSTPLELVGFKANASGLIKPMAMRTIAAKLTSAAAKT
jgi:glutamate synthase domain-containing protein 2